MSDASERINRAGRLRILDVCRRGNPELIEAHEPRLMAGEYFDQMLALEDSLIDDLSNRPDASRSATRISEVLLARAEDVRFTRALIEGITKKRLDGPAVAERPVLARQTALSEFVSIVLGTRFGLGVAIAALLLLALSAALFFRNQSLRNQLLHSEAQLNQCKEQSEAVREQLRQERSERESTARELETERNKRIEAESRLQGP